MLLDKNGEFRTDSWRHLTDEEPAPQSGDVTVSLKRFQAEYDSWQGWKGQLGLRLPNDAAAPHIATDVGRFALIVLNFPRFTDGRAYTQARILRDRLGFRGELRATGNVLRDQLLFMKRCGFDSFAVDEARAQAEDWARAFKEFDLFYQPATSRDVPILRQRLEAWKNAAE